MTTNDVAWHAAALPWAAYAWSTYDATRYATALPWPAAHDATWYATTLPWSVAHDATWYAATLSRSTYARPIANDVASRYVVPSAAYGTNARSAHDDVTGYAALDDDGSALDDVAPYATSILQGHLESLCVQSCYASCEAYVSRVQQHSHQLQEDETLQILRLQEVWR